MVRTSSTTPSEDQARKGLVKVETSLENIRDDILSLKTKVSMVADWRLVDNHEASKE